MRFWLSSGLARRTSTHCMQVAQSQKRRSERARGVARHSRSAIRKAQPLGGAGILNT
jgi:hypothetical protein